MLKGIMGEQNRPYQLKFCSRIGSLLADLTMIVVW